MHFLSKIIQTPIFKDPAKNHISVHRHFYRYSRGDFIGPALKISKTKAKITLKGSHEYEDLILEIITNNISNSEENFEIKGRLISGSNIIETITSLGFDWNLKRSTGKTKNYKAEILDHTNRMKLLDCIEPFRETSYFLISFNINPTSKVTTKKNIPQPSKKKFDEDDVNKRINFCTGIIDNTDVNQSDILALVLPDFKQDIPENWKSITVFNNYKITDIVVPKNIKDSRELRIMAVRKGKIFRSIDIGGEVIEKQYSIVV